MFSSKNLNQNIPTKGLFLKKKKKCKKTKFWRPRPHNPVSFQQRLCLQTPAILHLPIAKYFINLHNFWQPKKSIVVSKNYDHFSAPSLYDCAPSWLTQLVWRRQKKQIPNRQIK